MLCPEEAGLAFVSLVFLVYFGVKPHRVAGLNNAVTDITSHDSGPLSWSKYKYLLLLSEATNE